jgi:uncharacterized membrane protein
MANLGFWVGSLYGDRLFGTNISEIYFSIAWALALLAFIYYGLQTNRRFVINIAAVFGAIHFYTQWFEILGAQPFSLLVGGVLMIIFALILWSYNKNPHS